MPLNSIEVFASDRRFVRCADDLTGKGDGASGVIVRIGAVFDGHVIVGDKARCVGVSIGRFECVYVGLGEMSGGTGTEHEGSLEDDIGGEGRGLRERLSELVIESGVREFDGGGGFFVEEDGVSRCFRTVEDGSQGEVAEAVVREDGCFGGSVDGFNDARFSFVLQLGVGQGILPRDRGRGSASGEEEGEGEEECFDRHEGFHNEKENLPRATGLDRLIFVKAHGFEPFFMCVACF